MGERTHKVESEEKTGKVSQSIETDLQVDHPLLQLQQTIGNKAVTNLIQRHPEQDKELQNLSADHHITKLSVIHAHKRIGWLRDKINP